MSFAQRRITRGLHDRQAHARGVRGAGVSEPRDLDQILTDAKGEASVLRRAGHALQAEWVDSLVKQIADATEEFRRWMTEDQAELQSGMSAQWLRAHWHKWFEQGHAKRGLRGERLYRQIVVPRRGHVQTAREAGRRAGERSA